MLAELTSYRCHRNSFKSS